MDPNPTARIPDADLLGAPVPNLAARVAQGLAWGGFFALVLWAWWRMFAMARMAGLDVLGRPAGMSMMTLDRFAPLWAMWAVMMAAMMLPSLVPTLRAYDDLRGAGGARLGAGPVGWLGVLGGYLAVWIGFAALISTAQLRLLGLGAVDALGAARTSWLSGGLMMAVGAFQFSRLKTICHGVCHAPTLHFIGRWRPGGTGGLRMGAELGAYCLGCCWGLMVLGFVGGVMNLAWMGLATIYMVLEKLPGIGHRVIRPLGVALIAGGLAVIVAGGPGPIQP